MRGSTSRPQHQRQVLCIPSSPRHINLLPAYHRVAAGQAATDNKSRSTIHVFIADRSFDPETAAHKDQEYGSRTPVGYRDREMKGDVTYKDEDRFVALTLDCLSNPAGVDASLPKT